MKIIVTLLLIIIIYKLFYYFPKSKEQFISKPNKNLQTDIKNSKIKIVSRKNLTNLLTDTITDIQLQKNIKDYNSFLDELKNSFNIEQTENKFKIFITTPDFMKATSNKENLEKAINDFSSSLKSPLKIIDSSLATLQEALLNLVSQITILDEQFTAVIASSKTVIDAEASGTTVITETDDSKLGTLGPITSSTDLDFLEVGPTPSPEYSESERGTAVQQIIDSLLDDIETLNNFIFEGEDVDKVKIELGKIKTYYQNSINNFGKKYKISDMSNITNTFNKMNLTINEITPLKGIFILNLERITRMLQVYIPEITIPECPGPSPCITEPECPGPSPCITEPECPGPSPCITEPECPGPSPCITEPECPGPSPCITDTEYSVPSPNPSPTDELDFSTYKLNTKQLRDRLNKILDRQLGINVIHKNNLHFSEEGNKFIIKIDDINYSSITDDKKLNLEKLIQNEVHTFLHERYTKTEDKADLVDISRINIIAFQGSTIIVVQILPKKFKSELSKDEKDMLEFYNFMGILNKGKLPIRENDYLQHHYTL